MNKKWSKTLILGMQSFLEKLQTYGDVFAHVFQVHVIVQTAVSFA